MREELISPGAQLHALAIAQLRHERGDILSAWGSPVVLVVVQPSFRNPVAYEARRDRAGQVWAWRTRWRRDIDIARFPPSALQPASSTEPLTPTFEVAEGPLDGIELQLAVEALGAASVPAYPPRGAEGLDGTTFELALTEGAVWTRYRWWVSPPPGWEPLATFLHRFIELTDRAVHPSDRPPPA